MIDGAWEVGTGLRLTLGAQSDESWSGTFHIADAAVCAGHFPNAPIVPAIAVLSVVEAALAAWRDTSVTAWSGVRFRAPLAPGDTCSVELTARPEGTIWFDLCRGDKAVATGRLTTAHDATDTEQPQ